MKKILSKIYNLYLNVKQMASDRGIKKADIKKFLLVALFVLAFIIVFNQFPSLSGIVAITLFGILFMVLWFLAGYTVFRSLLVASVSLSFIIFIGQSYCSTDVVHSTNDSVKALIGFGFIYTLAQFLKNLYKELFGDAEAKEKWRQKGIISIMKEINEGKHSWLVLTVYILLIALFMSQIYQVVNPIIKGLCVYK
jgi:4-hydroxybenzoate polyprenyltransferase